LGTDVQFFATHRVVEGHAWAWADGEGLKRAFFYLGETDEYLLNSGATTPSEGDLECLDPSHETVPDESTVLWVAGAWSLDPTGLRERFGEAPEGYLGLVSAPAEADLEEPMGESHQRPWWKFW
jgi:hypothetical protein